MDDFLIILFVITITILIVLLSIKIMFTEPDREEEIKEFIKNHQYENAQFLITTELKKKPTNPILLYWKAEIQWLSNNKSDSVVVFENLETTNWGRKTKYKQHILFRLASWYKEQKMLDKALEKAEKALHLDETNSEYKILVGDIFLEYKNPEQALVYFKQASELDSQNVSIWKTMASIYVSLSNLQDAFSAYINAVNIDPRDEDIWFKLGDISALRKKTTEAIKFYSKAESGNTVISFNASYNIGQLQLEKNNREEGIASLEKALSKITPETKSQLDPSKILSARYTVAEYYLENHQINLALKEWENILNMDSDYLNVKELFQKHSVLYLDDLFKDMLTHTGDALISITTNFTESLGFQIDSFSIPEPEEIDIIARNTRKWNNSQSGKAVFLFWCSTMPLPSNFATHLHQYLDNISISKINIISAGPVFSELRETLDQKSVHIFDKNNIQELINGYKKNI